MRPLSFRVAPSRSQQKTGECLGSPGHGKALPQAPPASSAPIGQGRQGEGAPSTTLFRRKREERRLGESLASGGGRLSRPPAPPPLGNALPEGGISVKGSCCLRGGLAGKCPRGEADGPPVIPGAELPQPESGVARRVPDGGGGGGDGNSSQDGGEAADPDGQREAQQKHHAARQRGQDLEKRPRGESIGGTVAVGAVHLRGLRFGNLPDYSEYQDGHVKELVFKQDIFSCEL